MATNQTSKDSKGACEKIYDAICGIGHCPHKSSPPRNAWNFSPPATDPTRAQVFLNKPILLQKPDSYEVIPIELDPLITSSVSNEQEKKVIPQVPIQKNGQDATVFVKIKPASHGTRKEETKPNRETTEKSKTVGQGCGPYEHATKVAPSYKLAPPLVSAMDKPKSDPNLAQPKKEVNSDHDQVTDETSRSKAKPPFMQMSEKPRHKPEIQVHDQGAKATLKVKPDKPFLAVQEEQSKPKVEKASPGISKDESPEDKGEESKKLGQDNVTDKFTDYIKRVKNKMRTASDIGGGGGGGGSERSASRLDSLTGKASDFITRTKMKIRTTSNVGNGKSVSFK